MKVKLAICMVAVTLFFLGCGIEVAKKDEKPKSSEAEKAQVDSDEKTDDTKITVNGDGDETVEIGPDGVKVKNGDTEVEVSKDGVFVDSKDKKDSAAGGEKLTLNGVGDKESHECKGRRVLINGSKNTYSLTGECPRVLVNGTGQNVSIEKAGRIILNGSGNKVVYAEGIGGKEPNISKSGVGNSAAKK